MSEHSILLARQQDQKKKKTKKKREKKNPAKSMDVPNQMLKVISEKEKSFENWTEAVQDIVLCTT